MSSENAELTIPEALARAIEYYNNKDFNGASQICHKIVVAEEDNHDAWHFLAVIEYEQGNFDTARPYIDKALAISKEVDQYHVTRGLILINLDCLEEALQEFRTARHLDKNQVSLLLNLIEKYLAEQHFYKVIGLYETILIENSLPATALNNLAVSYHSVGNTDAAISLYEQIIKDSPAFITAYENLIHIYQKADRIDDLLRVCRLGLGAEPDNANFLATMEYAKRFECNWREPDNLTDDQLDTLARGDGLVAPFMLMSFPSSSNLQQQMCAKKKALHESVSADKVFVHSRPTQTGQRLKIAYISGDYREHVCARCIAGILELHDRGKFEVFAYSTNEADGSDIRKRVIAACDHFIDVSQNYSDQQLAEKISNDEIDILINLSGYTHFTRDTAISMKPAPIQVNYMGYPGTMGADYMDYIIVDCVVVPVEEKEFFTEQLVTLPDSYLINSTLPQRICGDITRQDYCLPEEGFVFCCFNSTYKITAELFDIWCGFLNKIPASVLWLPHSSDKVRANLEKEAAQRGIAINRLIYADFTESYTAHLAKYQLADLFLDTMPYNAHATAIDALWGGCPIVTCTGRTFSSRVASSLLTSIGLTELITTSASDYEKLVLRLASNPDQLSQIRGKLEKNRHSFPLFDSLKYVKHLESAYREMWDNYVSGNPPRGFSVRD